MFKIGEFSKLTQVSIRRLRFYDEQELLKPAYVDEQSGYRYYSLEQIDPLNKILFLREAGISINEMKHVLLNWDTDTIRALLEQKQEDMQAQIQLEMQKLAKLKQAMVDLEHQQLEIHTNVIIKQAPAYRVVSLRRTLPNYYCEEDLWNDMATYLKQEHIQGLSSFSICHDLDYREQDVDVEICVEVKVLLQDKGEFHYRIIPAESYMAATMVYGSFSNIAKAYRNFATWLSNHPTYKINGCDRQFVHRGPWNESDPSKYLTEIQIPLCLKK